MSVVFDYHALYQELNKARKARRSMSWSKVASRAGVTPSIVLAFARQFEHDGDVVPKTLSIESLIKLMTWLGGTDLSPYLLDTDEGTKNT